MGYPVVEGKDVPQAGPSPREAMLAVADTCIDLSMPPRINFSILPGTGRPVVSSVLLPALFENWDNVCSQPGTHSLDSQDAHKSSREFL